MQRTYTLDTVYIWLDCDACDTVMYVIKIIVDNGTEDSVT